MLGMISMRARRKEGLRGALNRPLFRKRSWTLSSQQTPTAIVGTYLSPTAT